MTIVEARPYSPFEAEAQARPQVMDADSLDEVFLSLGEHWRPDYSLYTRPEQGRKVMKQKFHDIATTLNYETELPKDEIAEDLYASLCTIDRFYDEWTSDRKLGDGSFAFMVPTRAERENGFAPEFRPFFPLTKHLGPRLGQLMLVGTPPFIVDRYHRGENGSNEQGIMLFSPVFGDMLTDIKNPEELATTFNRAIEDAIVFARDRVGITSVGLGAILPAVTNFGRSIDIEGVTTTTGHGGTIHLINETISKAVEHGKVDPDFSKIGVIGLGSIGASIASVMASEYPNAGLVLCDDAPKKVQRTIDALKLPDSRYETATSALSVLAMKDCNVIVSAVTGKIDIPQALIDTDTQRVNRLIVDDSQPTAVDPVDAYKYAGANVVWPIGESSDKRLHRVSFDYGDLGPIDKGVWGCEAEAFAAWTDSSLALRKPVDPESAQRIAAASRALGVGAAQLQCYGRSIE